MWLLIVAIALILGAPPGGAIEPAQPHEACEDQLGNTWFLPLDRYQAGMRPVGPCLPLGTWAAMRAEIEGALERELRREGGSVASEPPVR
jgi:hypothetical protein